MPADQKRFKTLRTEWFIGIRYLLSARKNGFLSVIAFLSILGVAAGVGLLVMVLAVMDGFEKDLRDRILSLDAHIDVRGENGIANYPLMIARLKKLSEVIGAAPYLEGEVLLSSGEASQPAILRGIDPEQSQAVIDLAKGFQGKCLDRSVTDCFADSETMPPMVLGAELAQDLKLYQEDEAHVQVLSPMGGLGPFGFEPRLRLFQVVDRFRSGFYDYDTQMAYIPLQEAQTYFASGERVTGIELKVRDILQTARVKTQIHLALNDWQEPLVIQDWADKNQKLFAAMKLEKIVMFIVLMLIVLVASFVIFMTMSMLALEKRGEIAVLKTIGATQKTIARIFILDGLVIGIVGAFLGLMAGLTICYLLARYQFVQLPPQYYVTTIPVVIQWREVMMTLIASIALAVLSGVYPALKAGLIDPLEVLRYE